MSQASHNTLDSINGGTKWCFAHIRPGQITVIFATEYLITSYRCVKVVMAFVLMMEQYSYAVFYFYFCRLV